MDFAIKTVLYASLKFLPKEIYSRLMSLRVSLSHDRYATLVSDYAPTLVASDEAKERFYEDLNRVPDSVPRNTIISVWGL